MFVVLAAQNGQHQCRGKKTDCHCNWHKKNKEEKMRKVELDVRRKALLDLEFPNQKVGRIRWSSHAL